MIQLFFYLNNKLLQLAEATIDAHIEMSKVVWLQSKFKDPMKTQMCLKSHTEEGTHVLKPQPPTQFLLQHHLRSMNQSTA